MHERLWWLCARLALFHIFFTVSISPDIIIVRLGLFSPHVIFPFCWASKLLSHPLTFVPCGQERTALAGLLDCWIAGFGLVGLLDK